MKCPVCQAKLLPVDGELFCLQCGNAVAMSPESEQAARADAPVLEETSDPVLQRAIVDAVHHQVAFRAPVESVSAAKPLTGYSSMRAELTPARLAPAALGGVGGFLVGVSQNTTSKPAANIPPGAPSAPVKKWRIRFISKAWSWGIAAFLLFVGVNMALYGYFLDRVYPGVKVGDTTIGGLALEELPGRLSDLAPSSKLTVTLGKQSFVIDSTQIGQADVERLEREIRELGHGAPLPLVGVVQSWLAQPREFHYVVQEPALLRVVSEIAQHVDRPAADAALVVIKGNALVITEKPGDRLDRGKLARLIRESMGNKDAVKMGLDVINPLVTAGGLRADMDGVQARLGLNLQLKVRAATYTPGAEQIGGWLVWGSAGKGITVDVARVVGYVNGLPGRFDRAAATNALVAAVQNGQSLTYTASTRRNVTAPVPASSAQILPRQAYTYCLSGQNKAQEAELRVRTAAVVGAGDGWALGGSLAFTEAQTGCNVTLRLMEPEGMAELDEQCAQQSTCQKGAVIALSAARWAKAPGDWRGTLESYRQEMISHEIGHWLGFDHPSCSGVTHAPLSQVMAVTVPGCSPNWYAIPAELQNAKVLPGF